MSAPNKPPWHGIMVLLCRYILPVSVIDCIPHCISGWPHNWLATETHFCQDEWSKWSQKSMHEQRPLKLRWLTYDYYFIRCLVWVPDWLKHGCGFIDFYVGIAQTRRTKCSLIGKHVSVFLISNLFIKLWFLLLGINAISVKYVIIVWQSRIACRHWLNTAIDITA